MGIVVDEMADCRLNVYYSRYNNRKKKKKNLNKQAFKAK